MTLDRLDDAGAWQKLARGTTDSDGRARGLLPEDEILLWGTYRLTFDTATYFVAGGVEGFYPSIPVIFEVRADGEHYHVPLLLSPYGYSTYRGS